jgi:hypothetical protein
MAGVLVLLSNMAQASNKKTSTKSTRAPKNTLTTDPSIRGEKRWLLLALLVSILFVAFVGNRLIVRHRNMVEIKAIQASQEDKARFMKVEADMKEARAAIIAAVGQPAHEEEDKSCSHASAKFKEGQLSCGIRYEFVYGQPDRAALVNTFTVVRQMVINTGNFVAPDQKILQELEDPVSPLHADRYPLNEELNQTDGVQCILTATQNNPRIQTDYGKYISDAIATSYILSCRQNMQRPIYPLAE